MLQGMLEKLRGLLRRLLRRAADVASATVACTASSSEEVRNGWAVLPGWATATTTARKAAGEQQPRPTNAACMPAVIGDVNALPAAAASEWRTLPGWACAAREGQQPCLAEARTHAPKRQLSTQPDPRAEKRFDDGFEHVLVPACGADEDGGGFVCAQPPPACALPGDLVHLTLHVCEEPSAMDMLMQCEALGEPDRVLIFLNLSPSTVQRRGDAAATESSTPTTGAGKSLLKASIGMIGESRVRFNIKVL